MICALRLLAVLRLGWSGLSASIEDFAIRIFNSWKLGSRDQDNGVLIVVAPQEHRVRIEFGYGLEDTLTDVAAERIIRNLMTPRLREGNYDVGVEAGATAVIRILEGRQPSAESAEWAAPPKPASGFASVSCSGPTWCFHHAVAAASRSVRSKLELSGVTSGSSFRGWHLKVHRNQG